VGTPFGGEDGIAAVDGLIHERANALSAGLGSKVVKQQQWSAGEAATDGASVLPELADDASVPI